jgi:hypothetical protein
MTIGLFNEFFRAETDREWWSDVFALKVMHYSG